MKMGEICAKTMTTMKVIIHDNYNMVILVPSMKGYLNNSEATAEFFTDDGFAAMGDLGYFDEEGKLFFKERMKDVLKVGSEKNTTTKTKQSLY